jgi:uncharacterized membrane protein
MTYLAIKWIHILSAVLLFGTGLGSAFYKWRTDRTGNLEAIYITNRNVVVADWIFTTPTVFIQPLTGLWLASAHATPIAEQWLRLSIILFCIAGLCWLPVVYLQIKMRDMACRALLSNNSLPQSYHRFANIWLWLGMPAFSAIIIVMALMVVKPPLMAAN